MHPMHQIHQTSSRRIMSKYNTKSVRIINFGVIICQSSEYINTGKREFALTLSDILMAEMLDGSLTDLRERLAEYFYDSWIIEVKKFEPKSWMNKPFCAVTSERKSIYYAQADSIIELLKGEKE